jgi:hypothetical protein
VIVGGNQKSGTTAIAALLAKATGSHFSNDPFWHVARRDGHARVLEDVLAGRLTVDEVVERYRAYFAAEIIKDPNFSFLYPELERRFPGAPQLFIVRDPRQNIRSILNRLCIDGHLEDLRPGHHRVLAHEPGWRAILAGDGLGIREGNHVARLAQRWNLAVARYLERRSAIHLARYEDFLADKAAYIGMLADKVGLRVTADIGEALDRPYQPRGDHSLSMDEFFGERNLALIESICAEGMARFGYAK